jgi:hypothetical protein
MACARQYFRIPDLPPNREPSPDSFQPPMGTATQKALAITSLMLTAPASIRRATRIPLSRSAVQTEGGIIGQPDGFGFVGDPDHGQGRAERLFTDAGHRMFDVDDHRRLEEGA